MGRVHRTTRRVAFRDTDAAGIMHFSVFFTAMEDAEHDLLRSVGLSVDRIHPDLGRVSWPRVAARCEYLEPARFEDILDIGTTIERLGEKSLTFRHVFQSAGPRIAEGSITSVCCQWSSVAPPTPIRIPDEMRAVLEPFVASE